jgi:hypothetical protein
MADGGRTFGYETYVEDEEGMRGASDGVRAELGELDVHRCRPAATGCGCVCTGRREST